jgi:predicted HicB family RNase H-like nuclease
MGNNQATELRYRPEDYQYSVGWSEEDQLYIGRVAEFPSLAAHGDSQAQALEEINQVVRFVLEDLIEEGEAIPEPFSKRSYSGKLNVRMPEAVHRRLVIEAAEQRVSLNQWINTKLALPATMAETSK